MKLEKQQEKLLNTFQDLYKKPIHLDDDIQLVNLWQHKKKINNLINYFIILSTKTLLQLIYLKKIEKNHRDGRNLMTCLFL